MKKIYLVIAFLLFATTLVGCAGSAKKLNEKELLESGAILLTQKDLTDFFSERRRAKFTLRSGSGTISYLPDGTQQVAWSSGGDEGQYRIENGQFCAKWNTVRKGKERCFRLYRSGDNEFTYVNLDGSLGATVAFEKYF